MSDFVVVKRFYGHVGEKVEGPWDVIELAGHLRSGAIGPDTLVCREGTEEWLEFRELPEWAVAQELPVETIAQHMEEKARVNGPAEPSGGKMGGVSWGMLVIFGVCVIGVSLWVLAQVGQPVVETAEAVPEHLPVPSSWTLTQGDEFSIHCPVYLYPEGVPGHADTKGYAAHLSGVWFSLTATDITGHYRMMTAKQILKMECDRFMKSVGFEIVSVRDIPDANNAIQEMVLKGRAETTAAGLPGRLRLVVTRRTAFAISVFHLPGAVSERTVDIFFDSFQLE